MYYNVKDIVDEKIASTKVVVFSKSNCRFCKMAVRVLQHPRYNLRPDDLAIIQIENMVESEAIQTYLKRLSGQRTVPRIFINREPIGGYDDLRAIQTNGLLREYLSK